MLDLFEWVAPLWALGLTFVSDGVGRQRAWLQSVTRCIHLQQHAAVDAQFLLLQELWRLLGEELASLSSLQVEAWCAHGVLLAVAIAQSLQLGVRHRCFEQAVLVVDQVWCVLPFQGRVDRAVGHLLLGEDLGTQLVLKVDDPLLLAALLRSALGVQGHDRLVLLQNLYAGM